MEGITGDSAELLRVRETTHPHTHPCLLTGCVSPPPQIALTDLHTSSAVANILPDLVQYLLETVRMPTLSLSCHPLHLLPLFLCS